MRRFFIEISEDTFRRLASRSLHQRRDVRDEAALIVEQALGREGDHSRQPEAEKTEVPAR